jgi:hypothetical protein
MAFVMSNPWRVFGDGANAVSTRLMTDRLVFTFVAFGVGRAHTVLAH